MSRDVVPAVDVAARVVAALADGTTRPAGELARLAGVSTLRARQALMALQDAGHVTRVTLGPHAYYRLARIAPHPQASAMPRPPRVDAALATARTCYGHLAGQLGVAWRARLTALDALDVDGDALRLNARGRAALAAAGLVLDGGDDAGGKDCLDWTERRAHLGGALGRNLTAALLAAGWMTRVAGSRALRVTVAGRTGFRRLGVDFGSR